MSITNEKLQTIKDNVSKVYRSGQMDVIKNANSLKGFESNKAMLLDDVSPVTHEMGVRVRGKNLFDKSIPYEDYTAATGGYRTLSIYVGSGFSVTVSLLQKYDIGIGGYFYCVTAGSPQMWLYHNSNTSLCNKSVTLISEDSYISLIMTVEAYNNFKDEIMVEIGTTFTAYTPYVPDLTAVKVSRCGKNLTNSLTDINAAQNSSVISRDNGIVTLESKNVITYSSMAHLYDRILSAGTYTFSFDCTIENIKKCTKPNYVHLYVDDKFVANVIYDMNKDGTYHRSFNFKITKKSSVIIRFYFNIDDITEASDTIITKAMFSNVQLEYGSTATDYEPYITPTEYTPTADGTVNGVTSLYPNTTLMTDTDGVLIDCEYYKDVDKAYNKLSAEIALSGGE